VWGGTAGRSFAGLSEYVVQRGLGFELLTEHPDSATPALDLHRLAGEPLDVPTTGRLVFDTYRYAGLLERGADGLESTSGGIASTLALPPALLVYAYQSRGDRPSAERALETAARLSPNSDLRAALRAVLDSAASDTVAGPR
jgi:hypothetical protein